MRRLSVNQPALLLVPCALISLVLAQISTGFVSALAQPLPLLGISLTASQWVADALLAIFFFVVGAELTHEFEKDRSANHIITPLLGALGGMALPALLYLAFASIFNAPAGAWGIPMATDLPISLALLALVGVKKAQTRMFLLALAIFDDLGSIFVIEFRFTYNLAWSWLGLAIIGALLYAFLLRTTAPIAVSVVIAIVVWYCTYQSGIHPTVAGALLGVLVPALRASNAIKIWEPFTNYIVLPLFVFTALAIPLELDGKLLTHPIVLALVCARIFGKPLGIMAGVLVARKIFSLHSELDWLDYWKVAVLGTVGFSVSLLFAELSLSEVDRAPAIAGILLTLPIAITISVLTLRIKNKVEVD